MPIFTPKLGLPVPIGPEIHRRQVIVDLANAIDDAAAAQDTVERPFFPSSLTYEAGPNRLVLAFGPGRARFGNTLVDYPGGTAYVNAPAINTTYYAYVDSTGAIVFNTTGAEIANAIQLASAAVGASTAVLTLTDRRGEIYGTAAAQPHTHDGVTTPTVAMLNNRFITGKDTPGAVDRNLIGLDAANSTVVGHNVAGRATRVLAGAQATVEVDGVQSAVFTTSLTTLIGGLTMAGPITGATTVAGTLTTAAQPNITSLGTLASLAVSGAGAFGSLSASGGITGTLTTAAQPNVTSIGTLVSLAVTGALSAGSFSTSGAVAGATLTGTLQTAAQPNITSLGTLIGLTMGGNIAMAGRNITGAGTVAATTLTGTLSTAAQPNITSLGTLTSLNSGPIASTSTITAGSYIISSSYLSAPAVYGTLQTAAQPNITSLGTLSSLAVSGALSAASASISGALSAGSVSASTLTGTLSTAAQPNVTSLGTLTGLAAAAGTATMTFNSTGLMLSAAAGVAYPLSISMTGLPGNNVAGLNAQAINSATSQPINAVSLAHGTAPLVLASSQQVYIRLASTAQNPAQWSGAAPGAYAGKFPITLDGALKWVPYYD